MPDRRDDTAQRMCDHLAAYELGALDDAERGAFENHLRACTGCRDELYDHAPAAVLLAGEPGRFADRMRAAAPRASWTGRLGAWWRAPLVRIAAPVALAAVLALVFIRPGHDPATRWSELATVEALPWTGLEMRSGGDDAARAFADAMSLYVAADWAAAGDALAEAAGALEAAGARPVLRDQAHLFAGMSHLLADDPDAAARELEIAVASPLPPVTQRAAWNLAQARLLLGDPEGALAALARLQDSPVYRERAAALAGSIAERR
jgi:hypothetical protein